MSETIATRIITRDDRVVARRLRSYMLYLRDPDGERQIEVTTPAIRIGSRKGADLVLNDPRVSRVHLEIAHDEHGFRLRDLHSTNGTFVDGVRANDVYLRPGARIEFGESTIVFQVGTREVDVPIAAGDHFGPLVGRSAAMRELFALLEKAAPTTATVLIEGESGTGKELVAEAIHARSTRADGPFVVFDCAAVPPDLVESELFGHEKGAFTGATARRMGRMEEADGGTLFLDELGELPLDLQPKLLMAIEKREIRRVGGTEAKELDVRIVAATNRDLAAEVNRGAFRADLYYRLAVVRVKLPPLRERREDVPLLVEHFVRKALAGDPALAEVVLRSISTSNQERLASHPWPGNVRELKSLLARTLALTAPGEAPVLEPPTALAPAAPGAGVEAEVNLDRPFGELRQQVLERFDRAYLTKQLERFEGNFTRAAAASGMDRMYFKRMLKKSSE